MEITVKQAAEKLFSAIKNDPELYQAYQANIAMSFQDEFSRRNLGVDKSVIHEISNTSAKYFLDLLVRDASPNLMRTGSERIMQERVEQVIKHGFYETDADYKQGELVDAALFCIDPAFAFAAYWPWPENERNRDKIINKSRIDQLTVAGAFLAAEIDRLLHEKQPAPPEEVTPESQAPTVPTNE